MERPWVRPVAEFYARVNEYIFQYGLPDMASGLKNWNEEGAQLHRALGDADGRQVLDCSCGWGRQTIALAKLGWQVTATDVSETSLEFAKNCAREEGLSIDFEVCDMRGLGQRFDRQFDWVISCYGLYEIADCAGIQQAAAGMFAALKPGGKCYMRFRDMDELIAEKPRHVFGGERRVPGGRIICIEDWDFISDDEVVAINAFLREDEGRDIDDHFRWVTETIGVRKLVLRKEQLSGFLQATGFDPIVFLPKPFPWMDVEVVATRPTDR